MLSTTLRSLVSKRLPPTPLSSSTSSLPSYASSRPFSSEPEETPKRPLPPAQHIEYSQGRNKWRSGVSTLRKKYLLDYEKRIKAEEAARQKEMEEIQRLKKIRLEKKRERAVKGVKRDMEFKKEMREARVVRLAEKRVEEEKKDVAMDSLRARVAEMLNTVATGDSSPAGKIIPSISGGGKPLNPGTGWIISSKNIEESIPEELFEGEGKAVGDVNYVGAGDWKYEIETDRKRRSFPEMIKEYLTIQEWENDEGEVTLDSLPKRRDSENIYTRLLERLSSRNFRAQSLDSMVRAELGNDHNLYKKFVDGGNMNFINDVLLPAIENQPAEDYDGSDAVEKELLMDGKLENNRYKYIMAKPFEKDEDAIDRYLTWEGLGEEEELYVKAGDEKKGLRKESKGLGALDGDKFKEEEEEEEEEEEGEEEWRVEGGELKLEEEGEEGEGLDKDDLQGLGDGGEGGDEKK
ncbi:hypothetical protein TrLO_g4612 [Triparma laevis f. longispina]|uniref:Uncharacterized protein n=1 Tax=Triparma laevis f. longispina TaxID=1714387 RepID=A0A9W7FSC5_9STRA|nr:hypothetical protein TrLO_g4612 [Triparma laevis f. longispina]